MLHGWRVVGWAFGEALFVLGLLGLSVGLVAVWTWVVVELGLLWLGMGDGRR